MLDCVPAMIGGRGIEGRLVIAGGMGLLLMLVVRGERVKGIRNRELERIDEELL